MRMLELKSLACPGLNDAEAFTKVGCTPALKVNGFHRVLLPPYGIIQSIVSIRPLSLLDSVKGPARSSELRVAPFVSEMY